MPSGGGKVISCQSSADTVTGTAGVGSGGRGVCPGGGPGFIASGEGGTGDGAPVGEGVGAAGTIGRGVPAPLPEGVGDNAHGGEAAAVGRSPWTLAFYDWFGGMGVYSTGLTRPENA